MSRYRLKKSKCRLEMDEILQDLNDRYKGLYLNDILFLDTILNSKYSKDMDKYIHTVKNINTYNTFFKFAITGTIRNLEQEDDELYIRELCIFDNLDIKQGYFMFIKEIGIFDLGDPKIKLYGKNILEYEYILVRLHNGDRYIIHPSGDSTYVLDYTGIIATQNPTSNYIYRGSSQPISFNDIENYIQMFRKLYHVLNLKHEQECLEFIQILEDFRDKLDLSLDKYHKFDDPKMLQLVLDIIASQTSERGVMSKIRRLNVENALMSEYERNIVEPKTLDDFVDFIYNILTTPDLIDNYELHVDSLIRVMGLVITSDMNDAKYFVLISSVAKRIQKKLREFEIKIKAILGIRSISAPNTMIFKDRLLKIDKVSTILVFTNILRQFLGGRYTFDKFIEYIIEEDYTKYYSDILYMWGMFKIRLTTIQGEIARAFGITSSGKTIDINPDDITELEFKITNTQLKIQKIERKISKSAKLWETLSPKLIKLEEVQQINGDKLQRLLALQQQPEQLAQYGVLKNDLQDITVNISQIQNSMSSNTNNNEILLITLQARQHELDQKQIQINNIENTDIVDETLLNRLQYLQQEYDLLQLTIEELRNLIDTNTNNNEELLTILQPLQHESNQFQFQINQLRDILTIQYHDKYKYKDMIDIVIKFIILYVSENDPNNKPKLVAGYLFSILYEFIDPRIQPDELIEELHLYIRTKLTEKLEEKNALGFIYNSNFEPIESERITDKKLHPFNIRMDEIFVMLDFDNELHNRSNIEIYNDWNILYDFIFEELLDSTIYRGTEMETIIHRSIINGGMMHENLINLVLYNKYKFNLILPKIRPVIGYFSINNPDLYINYEEWGTLNFLMRILINNALIFRNYNFWLTLDLIVDTQGYDKLMNFVDHMVDFSIYHFQNYNIFTKPDTCELLYYFSLQEYNVVGNNYMILYGEATVTYMFKILRYIIDNIDNLQLDFKCLKQIIDSFKTILTQSAINIYLKVHPELNKERKILYRELKEILKILYSKNEDPVERLINISEIVNIYKYQGDENESLEEFKGVYVEKEEYLEYFKPLFDELEKNENEGNIEVNIMFLGHLSIRDEGIFTIYSLSFYDIEENQTLRDYVYYLRNIVSYDIPFYSFNNPVLDITSYILEYYRHKDIKIMDILIYIEDYYLSTDNDYTNEFYTLITQYDDLIHEDYITIIPEKEDIKSEEDMILWLKFVIYLREYDYHGSYLGDDKDFSNLTIPDFQRMFPKYSDLIEDIITSSFHE